MGVSGQQKRAGRWLIGGFVGVVTLLGVIFLTSWVTLQLSGHSSQTSRPDGNLMETGEGDVSRVVAKVSPNIALALNSSLGELFLLDRKSVV